MTDTKMTKLRYRGSRNAVAKEIIRTRKAGHNVVFNAHNSVNVIDNGFYVASHPTKDGHFRTSGHRS